MTHAIFINFKIVIFLFLNLGAMATIKSSFFLVLNYGMTLTLLLITILMLNLITLTYLGLPAMG